MVFSCDLCFEPATIATSMAIDRPGAIDAALIRAGAQRRTAERRLVCCATNASAAGRGKKSATAVAGKAIEAKPSSGQIKPSGVAWDAIEHGDDEEILAGVGLNEGCRVWAS